MKALLIWWLGKLILAVVLVALGLGLGVTWIILREPAGFAVQHTRELEALKAEETSLRAAVRNADERMRETRTQIDARRLRAEQAAKVAHDLDELSGGLNRLTTSSEQLKENEQRLARMRQMEADSRQRVAELEQALTRIQWEKDGMEIAVQRNREKLTVAAQQSPVWLNYLGKSWDSYGKVTLIGAGLIMLGLPVYRFASAGH